MEVQANVSRETDILSDFAAKKRQEFAPVIAFVTVVVVCGFLGNIVSVAYYGFKVQRNNTTVSICVLAVVDAITCLVTSDKIIELCYAVTFRSRVGCQLIYFLNHTCVAASGLLFFYISVDRFRKVCFPFLRWYNIKTTKQCILGIAIIAVSLAARDFVILDIVRLPIQNGTVRGYYCTHTNDTDLRLVVQIFHIIDALIVFGVAIGLIIMYSMMVHKITVKDKKVTQTEVELEGNCTLSRLGTSGRKSIDFVPDCHKEPSGGEQCATDIEHGMSLSPLATDCTSDIYHINGAKREQIEKGLVSCSSQRLGNETIDKKSKLRTFPRRPHPKSDRNSMSMSSRIERQITKIMAARSLGIILSFVPLFTVNLMLKLTSDTSERELSVGIQLALRSYIINSAINPYIFCFFNLDYRRFVGQTILKYCRCT